MLFLTCPTFCRQLRFDRSPLPYSVNTSAFSRPLAPYSIMFEARMAQGALLKASWGHVLLGRPLDAFVGPLPEVTSLLVEIGFDCLRPYEIWPH